MRVFGDQLRNRARGDERFEARLDVLDAVPCGPDDQFGVRAGGAECLGLDERRDVVADVGVDDQEFHGFFRSWGSVAL